MRPSSCGLELYLELYIRQGSSLIDVTTSEPSNDQKSTYSAPHLIYTSITQLLARLGSNSDHAYVIRHQLNLFGGAKITRHGLNYLV